MTSALRYRPEVDGLRAIAVLPVLFFHAGFSAFQGGYVGVDIFFVISGFLITSIILAEKESGTFTLSSFYERRARRILPPLMFMMVVCALIAWLSLSPPDLRLLGQSMVAVTLFGSNVLFWRESGYFDRAAELKPLLHTWSLGVEEQYYVIFPLLLMLLWRMGRAKMAGALAIGLIASLGLAVWFTRASPVAAFFLLPTRAWELGVGSILAFGVLGSPDRWGPRMADLASLAGVVLIALGVFTFDASTPFPGLHALVPTVGAALLIWSAHPGTMVGRVLSSKPLVLIGLISYSTYLWHQPLFAFARHITTDEVSPLIYSALIAVSLALGFVSWKAIEAPFRDRRRIQRKPLVAFCLGSSFLVAGFGVAAYLTGGFPVRLPDDQRAFAAYFENSAPAWRYFEANNINAAYREECSFYDLERHRAGKTSDAPRSSIDRSCHVRDPRFPKAVFIWGDSHAQQFRAGLEDSLPKDWQILQVASSACPPTTKPDTRGRAYCNRSNLFALEAIATAQPDLVLVAQSAHHNPERMKELASHLRSVGARQVILMGPVPRWRHHLPDVVLYRLWKETPRYSSVGLVEEQFASTEKLKAEIGSDGVVFLSPLDHFCNAAKQCLTHIGEDRMRGIVSWDYGHLTPIASRQFARQFLVPAIQRIAGHSAVGNTSRP